MTLDQKLFNIDSLSNLLIIRFLILIRFGPESPIEDNANCFVGAFVGDNHFQVVTFEDN